MTIKRILIGKEEVKTCILVHEKPIEMNILLDHFSSGSSSVVDMALINNGKNVSTSIIHLNLHRHLLHRDC